MNKYDLDDQHQFIINDYDQSKTFASFLPSVAGVDGIPLWVYYVNRGQAISSFGVENKDNPIVDFLPANAAYRQTEITGFRTFIKVDGKVHEVFSSASTDQVKRRMTIGTNVLTVEEQNETLGLLVTVRYFTVSHEDYPGLIRKVTLKNLSEEPKHLELIDGLPTLWPAGVNNYTIKNMSNLSVAWNEVYNGDAYLPFYRLRSTTEDTAEVGEVEVGHFYCTVDASSKRLPILFDIDLIFAQNTALSKAENFEKHQLSDILDEKQIVANKLPSAFTALERELTNEETFYTVIGRMPNLEALQEKAKQFTKEYFEDQEHKATVLGETLGRPVQSKTAIPTFDAYVGQCFVDNQLRGGYPLVFEGKEGKIVYHVFSRIHGDMEREYNYFVVEPAFYSQGNGNFRDVNQNRRNDVYFVKDAGRFNIKQFMELIQLDGYNPLTIKGSSLIFDPNSMEEILSHVIENKERVEKVLQTKFTPGKLLKTLVEGKVVLDLNKEEFLTLVLKSSIQEIESSFGQGYWVDHWTYNMDLIDNYLNVFPEDCTELLFKDHYRYFESPASVLPRKDKYVLNREGKVRQLDPVYIDQEKIDRLNLHRDGTNWAKNQKGNLVQSNLFVKLLSLSLNKFATLDPFGMGIMMDAEKPGWNDAMNGLPAIFGSGLSETVELRRVINFLLQGSKEERMVRIPKELTTFLQEIRNILIEQNDELTYFNRIQDVREAYYASIRFGLSGEEIELSTVYIEELLHTMDLKLAKGIEEATLLGEGILPTFLTYTAENFELLEGKHPVNGLPTVKVTKWSVRPLPHFLEAPARYLKQVHDETLAQGLHYKVKSSQLYDEKLGMYVTSVPLDNETIEIGRIRAFTPGWLERESCFMHMEYKYLIGLLKSGLYDEYFDAIKTCLPPFMDPAIYGRSILENSSFIASSRNPNPNNHGRGFVARLTGTTSEMLSLWLLMMTGKKLFALNNGELTLNLNPILHSEFFDANGEVHFKLLNQTDVIYRNTKRKNTFGLEGVSPVSYELLLNNGNSQKVQGSILKGELAHWVRDGKVKQLIVELA